MFILKSTPFQLLNLLYGCFTLQNDVNTLLLIQCYMFKAWVAIWMHAQFTGLLKVVEWTFVKKLNYNFHGKNSKRLRNLLKTFFKKWTLQCFQDVFMTLRTCKGFTLRLKELFFSLVILVQWGMIRNSIPFFHFGLMEIMDTF